MPEKKKQKKESTSPFKGNLVGISLVAVALFAIYQYLYPSSFSSQPETPAPVFDLSSELEALCPVYPAVRSSDFEKDRPILERILNDPSFRIASAQKLSKAVQIDTQVFDEQLDVAQDPEVWTKFVKFHEYLEATFPTVYSQLKVDKINTYGLVFTWEGSDPSLKPLMFLAHQDVVPVQKDTLQDWSYPPFEGRIADDRVWGRGSADCKSLLIALLETVELLVDEGYSPKRGVILAFGFDEEASGTYGAHNISKFLLEKYGPDSIALILDEGEAVSYVDKKQTTLVAKIATQEKGYLDLEVALTTVGGHSSVPPKHTAIGLISKLVTHIEDHPLDPEISTRNPLVQFSNCLGAAGALRDDFKTALVAYSKDPSNNIVKQGVIKGISKIAFFFGSLITTTQATDLIFGGEKINALPESARVVINHRVDVERDSAQIIDRLIHFHVVPIAKEHGFKVTYSDYGSDKVETVYEPEGVASLGEFHVSPFSRVWEPAPESPSDDNVWSIISGTTRTIFEEFVDPSAKLIASPYMMPGNTDTRHYWPLTKNIYRYVPGIVDIYKAKIHSVDESTEVDAHLQVIAFYHEFIKVASEWEL
ncbi:Carboxypeptidase S [Komagataella phaffii CBS 7435]|uniref:Vacuolar carboxypeptidase yscS n=2 Tax=Komagataella phaffii TaxID=460519 RepID=C4R8M0_KOMPG|nr:Vacuolar carboxypeptidase yscS [Komagataella phaffii GS115]AOA64649.1 GQ67_05064T0 [Komagataella phaffii]CAH2450653.1 Carboxypeptidase S [Komagataella phaffii CBS 7435]AOA69757.1 GQ68_05045T0 [Komagataella phaffii GS115]CAY71945.1 Vacuolar carboxypeptidase yscS [Komagataella phaffii GS115]CCA40455.1 Carboxypeptidase S [Komagataella phaffii CBS 7435]